MQSVMITLLVCSVTMSVLVLLYLAAAPFLAKRYSVAGVYYAWLVLVIGLIIPFRPQFNNAIVTVDIPAGPAIPVIQLGDRTPAVIPAAAPNALPGLSWWQAAAAVWLVGMLVFFVYHGIRHIRFLKLTSRWSEPVADEQALALLQTLKAQLDLSQAIGLEVCDSIGGPMLIGFARPRILLPRADFSAEELGFILKHELVHCKRKDLWYKALVLTAAAIHWFNPVVHLMAKAIGLQCELSCDDEVIRSTDSHTRRNYSETIIGVVRYQSKLKTALSTNFYGGKKGMKTRIFSIMDTSKKKAGAVVLCGAVLFTLSSGAAFAANTAGSDTKNLSESVGEDLGVFTDSYKHVFLPDPKIFSQYSSYGISVAEDGLQLLYHGQPVKQFVDDKAENWSFYRNESGKLNVSAVRNASGKMTGVEQISEQKAQEYYKSFFDEETDFQKAPQDLALATDTVMEAVQEGGDKYKQYQPFGVTYSASDAALYYKEQRVKFLIDQPVGEGAETLWTDDAGSVNLAVIRDASGQITGMEHISDEKALAYQTAADEYAKIDPEEIEKRVEAKIKQHQ